MSAAIKKAALLAVIAAGAALTGCAVEPAPYVAAPVYYGPPAVVVAPYHYGYYHTYGPGYRWRG